MVQEKADSVAAQFFNAGCNTHFNFYLNNCHKMCSLESLEMKVCYIFVPAVYFSLIIIYVGEILKYALPFLRYIAMLTQNI